MTQEEKELLLKDLCARLPYGVMIQHPDLFHTSRTIVEKLVCIDREHINDDGISIEYVKPYLRPMSSMTENEKTEMNLIIYSARVTGEYFRITEYYNRNHLDYYDLIGQGLAIEAPDVMYNTK